MIHKLPYSTPEEKREYYIKVTAELIKRDIEHTRNLVARWPTQKVVKRYLDAMRYGWEGKPKPDVKWWAARKREVTND